MIFASPLLLLPEVSDATHGGGGQCSHLKIGF